MPRFLDTSAAALPESERFPAAGGFGRLPNVNAVAGPVLPGGLKVNVVLGLGDSLISSPGPTRRSRNGPSESSLALGT